MPKVNCPLSDDKENGPKLQPKIKSTRPTVKINKKDKPSLFTYFSEEWPDTQEGAIASWRAGSRRKNTDREELLELLQDIETYARALAVDGGCKYESTLDKGEGGIAGVSAEVGTQFYFAYHLESQVQKVKNTIEHFEKYNTDKGDRHRFYTAMIAAIRVAYDLKLLELKAREIPILRGREDSYNHKGKGTPEAKQKEAVRLIYKLVEEGFSQNKAAEIIGKDHGRSLSTVKGWIKKHRK
jgi:hypothetical protein